MKQNRLLRLICTINTLFIILACHAQNPSGSSFEEVMEDFSVVHNNIEEKNWENELQELAACMQEPVNLNTATREQLEQFPFLSDLQIEQLLAYVYLQGPMCSIYELQLVKEMDRKTIRYLLPFVCVEDINNQDAFQWKSMLKNALKYGKHESLMRLDIPFYRRKGYEHTYLGPPVYNSVKYGFRYRDCLYAGVTAEKDAGEPFGALHNRKGYDYYSFYTFLRDCGRLKALALGNYRLNFGQGLVLGSGFFMGKTVYASSFTPRGRGIGRHASTDETNYFRGVATTLSLTKSWIASGFYSHRSLDGKVEHGEITSIYQTGLHRSRKEADKKNAFTLQLAGGNMTYQHNRIKLGITGIYYVFNRPYEPKLTGYSKYNLHGKQFYNVGVDYGWRFRRFSFQGETAKSKQGWASLNHLQYAPVEGTKLMFIHRFYAYDYWGLFSRSFGEGNHVQNEQGYYLALETAPFARWRFFASLDLFRFPWKKYRVSKPSAGMDGLFQATFSPRRNLEMQLRYRYKQKERDLTASKGSVTLPTFHHQLRYRLNYALSEALSLRTTLDYNRFQLRDKAADSGYQATQMLSYLLPALPLKTELQATYFSTGSYDARVYVPEKGLLYTFYTPSFRGRGMRYIAHLRCDLNEHWMFIAKFGQTVYWDRSEIGSGNDLIRGNKKADLQMQLRVKF